LCTSASATIRGTSGNDVLVGTRRNDIIWGGGGDDVISGLKGNDRLCGGDGNDRLYGGSDTDYLDGGPGTDVLSGGSGRRDTCVNGEQRTGCEYVGTTTPTPTTTTTTTTTTPASSSTTTTTTAPTTPPSTGRFVTLPVGATLPTEQQCATRVRRMKENRPENATYNATKGTSPHDEFPRVTGNFTGTTDEILQWAACKWGIDEDIVRAQIALESWWTMTSVGDNGESFGLGQVRVPYHRSAFEDDNAKRSSAYNVDYTYQLWRDCFEGRLTWLNTVDRGAEYRSGDAMGCAGVWFSGRWRTPAANQYIARVDEYLRNKIWTQSNFGPSTPVGSSNVTTTTTTTTTAPTTTLAPNTTPAPNTTAAPTTTRPPTTTTTTVAPTTTTRAPTTTAAPTTTTPPTTPSSGAFVATFDTPADFYDRFDTYTGNYCTTGTSCRPENISDSVKQFQGTHSMACEAPPSKRTVDVSDHHNLFWWCGPGGAATGHVMTGQNATGYTLVNFSPKQSFTNVRQVCWDVSLADYGGGKWANVVLVPEVTYLANPNTNPRRVADGEGAFRLDYVTPNFIAAGGPGDFNIQDLGSGAGAIVGVKQFKGTTQIYRGGNAIREDGDVWTAGADESTRYRHCFRDNRNGTLTYTQQRATGLHTVTTNGSFPTGPVRVIFQDDTYNADKHDGTGRYTMHWDNISIE
jgi:autotransporter family porin